jgi:hypothetical protein
MAAHEQPRQPQADAEQRQPHRGLRDAERDDRAGEVQRQLDEQAQEEEPGPSGSSSPSM